MPGEEGGWESPTEQVQMEWGVEGSCRGPGEEYKVKRQMTLGRSHVSEKPRRNSTREGRSAGVRVEVCRSQEFVSFRREE